MNENDKLSGFDWNLSNIMNSYNHYNAVYAEVEKLNRQNENICKGIQEEKERREAEKLRQHNELIAAIKKVGEKGATINIGNNVSDVQIQHNSPGATQTMKISNEFDYETAEKILKEIKGCFETQSFEEAFGDNSENVKALVNATLESIERKEDEGVIKKALGFIRDLAAGAGGNLVATGITALIGKLL